MPHGKVAVNYKKITDMRMEIKNDDDKVKTLAMFSSKEEQHILLSGCVKKNNDYDFPYSSVL